MSDDNEPMLEIGRIEPACRAAPLVCHLRVHWESVRRQAFKTSSGRVLPPAATR